MTGRPRPGTYQCGIEAAMGIIRGKWKILIVWALGEQPRRFGELRRLLPGVTEKVLASHLRELERDDIVRRRVYDETPPHVEYSLTTLGTTLDQALRPLGAWGREHLLDGPGAERRGHHVFDSGAGDVEAGDVALSGA